MIKTHCMCLLVFSVAAVSAQTRSQAEYRGQSWVGLLVSASCDGGKTAGRSKADHEADRTVSARTTTPAVDDAGTRGASTTADKDTASGGNQTKPETGDVMAKGKSSTDPGWSRAMKQAHSLGAACTLEANTSRFALLLPDGTMMQFDELANQAIQKQMPPVTGGGNRHYLRVSVQGKLQNGKIALDTIQM